MHEVIDQITTTEHDRHTDKKRHDENGHGSTPFFLPLLINVCPWIEFLLVAVRNH
jgi:hypothetical protein